MKDNRDSLIEHLGQYVGPDAFILPKGYRRWLEKDITTDMLLEKKKQQVELERFRFRRLEEEEVWTAVKDERVQVNKNLKKFRELREGSL